MPVRLLALMVLVAGPASGQARLRAGVDAGYSLPAGDLGGIAKPGFVGRASVMLHPSPGRYAFGLEFELQRLHLDAIVLPGFDTNPPSRVKGPDWTAYGFLARLDYAIYHGLYALGGAGDETRDDER
jgi:hypothetical protein